MTYQRVIPRDLFNEANLLKCLGRLWILLDEKRGHGARLGGHDSEHGGEPFNVMQDEGSGSIFVGNISFTVRGKGYMLSRPLNSRAEWPLYMTDPNEVQEEIAVFNEDGWLSHDFCKFIMGLT